MPRRPLVFAHRGASGHAPENTIEAFTRARDLGADGVELDVRRTADEVLVVHHDAAIDGVGLIAAVTFADLRAARPELPTLAEALDACVGLIVNVEIKCLPWEPDPDPGHEVVRRALDLARDQRADVIVSSFFLGTVDAAREHAPDVPTAFLVHGVELSAAAALAAEHGHRWLHPDVGNVLARPEIVAECHAAGLLVDVWTVDDPEHVRTLATAGVDAVITNWPDVALAALSS